QTDHHTAADRSAEFKEHGEYALQRQQLEAADQEQGEGGNHGAGKGLVGDPVPEHAGDHREDDGAPQCTDKNQHGQDVEFQAGEDDPNHRRDNHGQPADPEHDGRVGFALGQVFAIDVGHDDGG